MTPSNDGYRPKESVSILDTVYILGHDPSADLPYSTWQKTNGICTDYQYFSSVEIARRDLLRRAIELLPEEEHTQLILSALDETSRRTIVQQGREEVYLADIESCLESALKHLGIDESLLDVLMESKEFQQKALHIYFKQDHSYENEALSECLEDLIQEQYPDLLPKSFNSTLKISPELADLLHEILSKTGDEIDHLYGAYEEGSGALALGTYIPSPNGRALMNIYIYPKATGKENTVELELSVPLAHGKAHITTQKLTGVESIEQIFSVTDPNGCTWSVDVHADERLRRIGNEFIFLTDSTDSFYSDRNHKPCTVIRQLTPKEDDVLYSGMMWKVQFGDGTILDAFDSELEHTQARKVDLSLNPDRQPPRKPDPETWIPCEYISAWADWGEVRSNAKYDPLTNEVCEIEPADLTDEELEECEILTGEYMELNGTRYELFDLCNSDRRSLNVLPDLSFLSSEHKPFASLLEDAIHRSDTSSEICNQKNEPQR